MHNEKYYRSMLTRLRNNGLRSAKVVCQLNTKFFRLSNHGGTYFGMNLIMVDGLYKLKPEFSTETLFKLFNDAKPKGKLM